MPITIHLGVTDVPYRTALPAASRRVARWRHNLRPWQRIGGTTTTGDVAEILEKRYGLFSMFATFHGADIVAAVESAMEGKLENLLLGKPIDGSLFSDNDLSDIEQAFRKSIDEQEYDSRVPGVPTAAAQRGVNHRLMHPYRRGNPSRPSFLDTGLMQGSFRAWVTE